MDDVCRIVESARHSQFFGDRFFNQMFQTALKILPGGTTAELVQMMRTFSDRQSNVQDFTSRTSKFKEHIVQDMERIDINDLCYLIELFNEDLSFSKYLLDRLLERKANGKKLDFDTFTIAFLNSLQHKEHIPELVEALFSYETFFNRSSNKFFY